MISFFPLLEVYLNQSHANCDKVTEEHAKNTLLF